MSATPAFELHYPKRAEINRANSQHSTGPRTETGKLRSSQNALRHGLTARTAVLTSEDQAAYESHCRKSVDHYQPANATETELVQELADTSWRLRRIPILEAGLFAEIPSPEAPVPALSSLGLHGTRLSRQFQKLASWWLRNRIPRGWAGTATDLLHEIAVTTVTRRPWLRFFKRPS